MKIALTAAILALAGAWTAGAAELSKLKPAPTEIPACVSVLGATTTGSAARMNAAAGEIPCPQYLSTSAVPKPRGPQRT